MSKIIKWTFFAFLTLILGINIIKIFSGTLSENLESESFIGNLKVKVNYNKNIIRKEPVFGYLVPYNIVWRTGSKEATEISFSEDCNFGNRAVKAGTYSLWTIPAPEKWTVILNKETGQYGTHYDPAKDYIRTVVKADSLTEIQPDLSLDITRSDNQNLFLAIRWDKTIVKVPISTK